MRLPYIQVTREAWDYASQLSALLGTSEAVAFKLLCDLWRWGLSLGDAEELPDGVCDDARAEQIMCAAVRWPGDSEQLLRNLVSLGLVDDRDNKVRVCGMDRYHGTLRKNWGVKVDRTGSERVPNGFRTGSVRKTKTKTNITTKALRPIDAIGSPAQTPNREASDRLCASFFELRGSKYAFAGAKDGSALAKLLKLAPLSEIDGRWRAGLVSEGWTQVSTIAQLLAKWNDLSNVAKPEKKHTISL